MELLKNFDQLLAAMGLLVPGLVILFVRSQFVTDRRSSQSAALLSYLTVSLVYYAIALPFFDLGQVLYEHDVADALLWFAFILGGPVLLGLFLGINVQKNLLLRFLKWCGLNPVHAIPTAWDWKFGNMDEEWVLVTLKDDTRFVGFCGQGSFISSDPTERDIYIEQIYDIDSENNWSWPGRKGILIAPGEVRTIEFWPYTPQEDANEQS